MAMSKIGMEESEAAYLDKLSRITNRRLADEDLIAEAAINALTAQAEAQEKLQQERLAKETEIQKKIADQGLIATEEMYRLKLQLAQDEIQKDYDQQMASLAAVSEAERVAKQQLLEDEHNQKLAYIADEINSQYEQGKIAYAKAKAAQAKEDEKAEKERAKREEKDKKEKAKRAGQEKVNDVKTAFSKGQTFSERKEALKSAFDSGTGNPVQDLKQGFAAMTNALSDFTKQLDSQIDSIAKKQSSIDTRLQSSKNETYMGSYWNRISKDITNIAGISPLVTQEAIVSRVEEAVGKGIAYNIEQRAFLATVKDKIATTFDAFDGSLSRLVRIQQTDSTAARLGMESAMTAFLNNMYETTEYLTDVAKSVRSSIEEASALMTDQAAVEMEYQVQKWLGSLYSVGMSQNAVSTIANTFGQIASGDISGITNGGSSNLMLMAANRAGISVSEALSEGLDTSNTNKLMQAMVDYLAEIYEETKDSKLLQQQYANIFGVKASDLKAAANLSTSVTDIATNNLTYNTALTQLGNMAGSMYSRTSIGELLQNASSNFKYTMASGIASNPALYGIYKTANILDDLVGGINIPAISVLGNGIDLNASVADLMRVAALSGSVISGVMGMINSGSSGGLSGSAMLSALGIGEKTSSVSRGTGSGLTTSGVTVSSSGYVGNSNSSDVQNKTLSDANNSANQQLVEAQESDESDIPNKTLNESIISIYQLLQDVTTGANTLNVRVADYGLVWNK